MHPFLNRVFLLFLFLSACAVNVSTQKNKSADFQSFKTFAWYPRPNPEKDYWHLQPSIEDSMIALVNAELSARGYQLDVENPDILLAYYVYLSKQEETIANIHYIPRARYSTVRPYYARSPYRDVAFTEGTVIVDVIERSQDQLIWRGTAVAAVFDREDLEKELPRYIHKIFSRYPVARLKKQTR